MKKILKHLLVAAMGICLAATMFGCNGNKGLQENDEWNSNPSTVSRNKETAHSPFISCDSVDGALNGEIESSPNYLSLNGTWSFDLVNKDSDVPADFVGKGDGTHTWDTITVPGSWSVQGFSEPTYTYSDYAWDDNKCIPPETPEDNEIGLYKRTIDVPASWSGREVFISLEGVESACYVYVNGQMAGYGEDSYTTKDFRITSYINYGGQNTVAVKVFKYCDASWLEANDSLHLGGIYRDVYLYSAPKTTIKDVTVDIQLSKNFSEGVLTAKIDYASYSIAAPGGATAEISVYDENGKLFIDSTKLGTSISFTAETVGGAHIGTIKGRSAFSNPILWSAENPYLYTAVAVIKDSSGAILDCVSQKIGFRDAGFSTDENGNKTFTVNGSPVSLYGVVYTEHSAITGKTVTKEEMLEDILLMKKLNINAVRSPGQALSNDFIALCDEYGMYVVSDISIETDSWSRKDSNNIPGDQGIWQTALLDRLTNVLKRDKNNASVIMWSLGNQAGDGSNMETVKNWLITNESRMIMYDVYIQEQAESIIGSIDDDDDNVVYDTIGDIISATDIDLVTLCSLLTDSEITKPVILQNFDKGLLNAAGDISSIVEMIDEYSTLQGGFLAFYSDRSIYYPIDRENAVETVRDYPYAENPDKYELTYAASWNVEPVDEENDDEEESNKDVIDSNAKYSLSGIVNSDRSLQTDALELKRAYAPIFVNPVNIKNGVFSVLNRNSFTAFDDNYVIDYEVFKGTDSIKKGTVTGLSLAALESTEITLDYGNISVSDDYFVTVTVSYKNTPVWADSDYDKVISRVQYEITSVGAPVKDGKELAVSGSNLKIDNFCAPEVVTNATDLSNGIVYITNGSYYKFDDIFSVSYDVVETNTFWNVNVPVVCASGTVAKTGIGAFSDASELKLGYDVKAIDGGIYVVYVYITTKVAVGDIPAGYKLTYKFSATSLDVDSIPFALDPARIYTEQYDEVTGQQAYDANGNPIWLAPVVDAKGNVVYEDGAIVRDILVTPAVEDIRNKFTEETANSVPSSYLKLSNDSIALEFDTETGLIKSFTKDGEDLFATADYKDIMPSLIGNLYRNPTGGDWSSEAGEASNIEAIKTASSIAGKLLSGGFSLTAVSATHYRVSLSYLIPHGGSISTSVSKNSSTKYNIVYDIYANGVINVSVSYSVNSESGIPLELSNIITLSDKYDTVKWYGRGEGETYPDKLYDSTVGEYVLPIQSLYSDYLMFTGSGDRSQVRWMTLTDSATGKGVMITSDDNNFAFNVSKAYPWENINYASSTFDRDYFVVRVIGVQRGVSAGNLSDQFCYNGTTVIEPGSTYSYSFRIAPITSSDNAASLSAKKISSVGKARLESSVIDVSKAYALSSVAGENWYITYGEDTPSVKKGIGSDNQIFRMVYDGASSQSGFLLRVLSSEKSGNEEDYRYITPVGNSANKAAVEVGLAPYNGKYLWQTWRSIDTELLAYGTTYSLAVMNKSYENGGRLSTILSEERDDASWTITKDTEDESLVTIRSNFSERYLTVVDNVTYRTPILKNFDLREFMYPPSTDWEQHVVYSDIIWADVADFAQTSGHITQWSLLPADTQMWRFNKVGDGEYTITNVEKGVMLGIRDEENAYGVKESGLVEYNPNNSDETAASLVWVIKNTNGVSSIINKDYGFALGTSLVKVKMTSAEKDYYYITNSDEAFLDSYVLTLGEYNGSSNQKWNLLSEDDLGIDIEIGDDWFVNDIAKKK